MIRERAIRVSVRRFVAALVVLAVAAAVAVIVASLIASDSTRGPRAAGAQRFDLSTSHGQASVPGFSRRYLVVGAAPGAIPAITRPRFDSAAAASKVLLPDEPVLGVDLGGDARAYPIELLSLHEAVNDVVDGTPIVITWCPLCSSGLVFDRRVAGRTLTFGISGYLYQANQVLFDQQTRSLWSQLGDGAVTGTMRGRRLELVPAVEQPWSEWRRAHPGTRVLSIRGDVFAHRLMHPREYLGSRGEESSDNPYLGYQLKVAVYGERIDGVSSASRVVGLQLGGQAKAYPDDLLARRHVIDDTLRGIPIVLVWDHPAGGPELLGTPRVFSRRLNGRVLRFRWDGRAIRDTATGSRWQVARGRAIAGPLAAAALEPVPFTFPYWFAWRSFHPNTAIAR